MKTGGGSEHSWRLEAAAAIDESCRRCVAPKRVYYSKQTAGHSVPEDIIRHSDRCESLTSILSLRSSVTFWNALITGFWNGVAAEKDRI
jgi:predicted ABC-type ATPase